MIAKNIFHRTDYKLLTDQKIMLRQIMNKDITIEQKSAIEGILYFLDAFQDEAVDVHNKPENEVFPYLTNEDL